MPELFHSIRPPTHYVHGTPSTQRSVQPVVSAFSEGQGETGVEKAGLEIYNGGLERLCESNGWKMLPVLLPLTTTSTGSPRALPGDTKKADELTETGVRNCRRVGTRLGVIADAMAESMGPPGIAPLLLNLGGDHSVAAASVSTMLARNPDLRVIWVDAHADCNTPQTSPSGNYHGMVLGHLLGWFGAPCPGFEWINPTLKEENLGYIGLRDIDGGERNLLHRSKCTYLSMSTLEQSPFGDAIDQLIHKLDPQGIHPFHISFDVDGADPHVAPGTGTRCEGGLTYSQSLRIVEKVAATGRLVSMDVVEVNVDMDTEEVPLHGDDASIDSPYKTVKFALHLIRAALGYLSV